MLINCPECGNEISWDAKTCPHCGAKNKLGKQLKRQDKNKKMFKFLGYALLVMFGLAIIGAFLPDPEKKAIDTKTAQTKAIQTVPEKKGPTEEEIRQYKYNANEARKVLRSRTDPVENITWRQSKLTPKTLSGNVLYCYIGEKDNTVWLRAVLGFTQSDWIFMDSIKMNIDGKVETINIPFNERKQEVEYGGIREWIDMLCEDNALYYYMERIANSKKTLVRFSGETYNRERTFTVSETQKKAIKEVLKYYNAKKALENLN